MTVKDIDSMSFDELKNEFIQFRKMMMDHISEQEKQIQDYKKKNEVLTVNIKELQLELAIEKEKYNSPDRDDVTPIAELCKRDCYCSKYHLDGHA